MDLRSRHHAKKFGCRNFLTICIYRKYYLGTLSARKLEIEPAKNSTIMAVKIIKTFNIRMLTDCSNLGG
jgi:hypothetical protein